MPSHRVILHAGPLVVESRFTTRDLGDLDAGDAITSASDRADDDGMALRGLPIAERSADPAAAESRLVPVTVALGTSRSIHAS